MGNRFQSSDIGLLSLRSLWCAGSRLNPRGEVPDPVDREAGSQAPAHFGDVEPFIWRTLHSSVVEVEAIYVEIGLWRGGQVDASDLRARYAKRQRPPCGGLDPAAEATGEVGYIYYRIFLHRTTSSQVMRRSEVRVLSPTRPSLLRRLPHASWSRLLLTR